MKAGLKFPIYVRFNNFLEKRIISRVLDWDIDNPLWYTKGDSGIIECFKNAGFRLITHNRVKLDAAITFEEFLKAVQ